MNLISLANEGVLEDVVHNLSIEAAIANLSRNSTKRRLGLNSRGITTALRWVHSVVGEW